MNSRYYCPKDQTHKGITGNAVAHVECEFDEHGHWVDDIDTYDFEADESTCSWSAATRSFATFRCSECDASVEWGIPPSPLEQLAEAADGEAGG